MANMKTRLWDQPTLFELIGKLLALAKEYPADAANVINLMSGSLIVGGTIVVANSRDIANSDNGATLECSNTITLNVPQGLPSSFSCYVIPYGTTSISRGGTTLLNGANTTLTRANTGNALFAIVSRASVPDSYVVTGS